MHEAPGAVDEYAAANLGADREVRPHKQEHHLVGRIRRFAAPAALDQVRFLLALQYLHLHPIVPAPLT